MSLDDKKIRLIYIGQRYYLESGTSISSVYKALGNGTYERYDFGFLQRDLELGFDVSIRQATRDEIAIFEKKLKTGS